jgi:hypothetical protein
LTHGIRLIVRVRIAQIQEGELFFELPYIGSRFRSETTRVSKERTFPPSCAMSEIKHAHANDEVRQEMAKAKYDQRHVLFAATARPC